MNTNLFITLSLMCKQFKINDDIRGYIAKIIKNEAVNKIIKIYRFKVLLNIDIFKLLIKEDEIIQNVYHDWFVEWPIIFGGWYYTPEEYLSYLFKFLIYIDKNLSPCYVQETGSWLEKLDNIGDIYHELMIRYDIIEVYSGNATEIGFYEILDNIKSKITSSDIIYKNTGIKWWENF